MAPDAAFSNISDKNEFTKFTKFLAYKGVQVVVESRKGVKIEPNSKPRSSDTDWFNLQIPDSPEVNQATKNVMPSDKVLEVIKSQLHVEISVKTEDGDEMVLELWTLGLDETQYDSSIKAMTTIYFRMGILLKSLITTTRITPAYHLSRKQRTESFTIFYRVYAGEAKDKALGDSVKRIQAGLLKTPLGGLSFSVLYRTNFSISPNKSQNNKTLLLKSDHFELSPKHVIFESKKKKEQEKAPKPIKPDVSKFLRVSAFVDDSLVQNVIDNFLEIMPVPKCKYSQNSKSPCTHTLNPTESKSTQDITSDLSKNPTSYEVPPKKFAELQNENDPPIKLLQFPFAYSHPIRELAEFYKDFFNAPHLKLTSDLCETKSDTPTIDTGMAISSEDFSLDLEEAENSVHEFDELLADMCKSAEWSGN